MSTLYENPYISPKIDLRSRKKSDTIISAACFDEGEDGSLQFGANRRPPDGVPQRDARVLVFRVNHHTRPLR